MERFILRVRSGRTRAERRSLRSEDAQGGCPPHPQTLDHGPIVARRRREHSRDGLGPSDACRRKFRPTPRSCACRLRSKSSPSHRRSTAAILPIFDSPPTNPDDAPWTLTSRRPTRRRRAHASATRAPSPGPESIRTVRGATARPGSLTLDEPNPCSRLGPTHGGLGQTASTRRGRAGRVCEREESRGSAVVRRPSSVAGELPETGLRLGIGCAWHHRVRAVRHADHCSGVVALSGPMAAPTRSGSF